MKRVNVSLYIFLLVIFFSACSKQVEIQNIDDDYKAVFDVYKKNCQTQQGQKLYGELCQNLDEVQEYKKFFQKNFTLQNISQHNSQKGLLTGYYEPLLYGSLEQTKRYKYPIYAKPKDLLHVRLETLYPSLKKYTLRGRLDGKKVVPYYTRAYINEHKINAKILCYCDSKIDRFFLEVQGSGRVQLENNTTLFLGYSDKNGYPYRSIGKYLIEKGAIAAENISLDSIRKYLELHPAQRDEVLNYNQSFIFFQQKDKKVTGALGVELTPYYSVAVDTQFISLGSMLVMDTFYNGKKVNKIVFAQDRGGAIKGSQRADLFLGYSKEGRELASKLKAPLSLWLMVPKQLKRGE